MMSSKRKSVPSKIENEHPMLDLSSSHIYQQSSATSVTTSLPISTDTSLVMTGPSSIYVSPRSTSGIVTSCLPHHGFGPPISGRQVNYAHGR